MKTDATGLAKLVYPQSQPNSGPKRGAASRSARLEEKLDDLVALLRTQQGPVTPSEGDNADTCADLDDDEVDYGADSPSTSLARLHRLTRTTPKDRHSWRPTSHLPGFGKK